MGPDAGETNQPTNISYSDYLVDIKILSENILL